MELIGSKDSIAYQLPGSEMSDGFVRRIVIDPFRCNEVVGITLKSVMAGKSVVTVSRMGKCVEIVGCAEMGQQVKGDKGSCDVEAFNGGGVTTFNMMDDVADYCLVIERGKSTLMVVDDRGEVVERASWLWRNKMLILLMLIGVLVAFLANRFYGDKAWKQTPLRDYFHVDDLEDIFGSK
ncbi:hypothetical protein AbHV_ORF51 [Abalone herpesvirus Victoria/AUS/2009]|uniref:Uncharacterized protein n=1 Tax=Abalone herpesvirus (isolate Abalone/Australia/Victoria/2009) TaxID=1241371 RepID=K4JV51_ABHV|nr:hypothetical protein AbHV_ORF51 [Abalone herpesvirus Victoria/AUS/2009]AFU90061.1 hypothetical protein AbHV_ORF51 [Abalone herpesvirus Victoria/AUS/2009]UCX57039.1 ORF48 [Haliotid herpesvirus 1]